MPPKSGGKSNNLVANETWKQLNNSSSHPWNQYDNYAIWTSSPTYTTSSYCMSDLTTTGV